MQQQDNPETNPVKPDLKHDTMEYSASTDGEDILDLDTETAQEIEDEEITADELELLEDDSTDGQAAALDSVETDREADEDNFLTEANAEEDFEDNDKTAIEDEYERK